MVVYIYILKHPLTGDIKYVGKTNNIKARFSNHLTRAKKPGTHIQWWIKSLLDINLIPVIEIIEQCNQNWEVREVYWITYYKKTCQLCNHTDGGEGAYGRVRINVPEVLYKIDKACVLLIEGYTQNEAELLVDLALGYLSRVRNKHVPWARNYCILLPKPTTERALAGLRSSPVGAGKNKNKGKGYFYCSNTKKWLVYGYKDQVRAIIAKETSEASAILARQQYLLSIPG